MPLTSSEFDNHALWASVDELEASFNDTAKILSDQDNAKVMQMLPLVVSELRALKEIPSWRFTNSTMLDQLENQADTLTSHITAAKDAEEGEPAQTQFSTLVEQGIDQINTQLNTAPRPITGARDGKGLVTALREMGELHQSRATGLKAELDALNSAIESRKEQLTELENQIESAGTSVTEHVTRLDAAITKVTDEFIDQVTDWKKTFDEQTQASTSAANEARSEDEESARMQREALEAKATETLEKLDELHTEARGVVGATAERTTASDFEGYAASQETAAKWWAIFAVLLGAGAVGMIVFLVARSDESSELLTVLKALGSLGLLGIMAFAARQVTFHRSEAKDARQISLSLKAMGPFVATLPEDQQQAIRRRIALHIFGRPFGRDGQPIPSEEIQRDDTAEAPEKRA